MSAPADPPRASDDRAALLRRGRAGRAVRRTDEHLAPVEAVDLTAVPAPYDARGNAELDEGERADLATCERAVAGLQKAFVVAGKALATINQARLYRETHATFAEYVEDRWEMKRAHAYRLIDAWPVGAALSPIGDTATESQVRELLPAVKAHGLPAARAVYEAVQEQGGRVTAARLREAVRVLPSRLSTPDQAADVIRVAAVEGRLPRPSAPADATPEPTEGDRQALSDAELGSRALVFLAAALDAQQRTYDRLAEAVPLALSYDPNRAQYLLRELRQHANRTAYRAGRLAGDNGADAST